MAGGLDDEVRRPLADDEVVQAGERARRVRVLRRCRAPRRARNGIRRTRRPRRPFHLPGQSRGRAHTNDEGCADDSRKLPAHFYSSPQRTDAPGTVLALPSQGQTATRKAGPFGPAFQAQLGVFDYETARPDRWLRRCLTPNPTAVIRISAAPNETAAPTPASRKSKPDEGGTMIAVSPTVALPMFLLS